MSDSITVKIKELAITGEEDGKKQAIYKVEPFDYGDHNYSRITIEYQNESDLAAFEEGKSIKITVGKDMVRRYMGSLLIEGGT
jgi:hypothetical protein